MQIRCLSRKNTIISLYSKAHSKQDSQKDFEIDQKITIYSIKSCSYRDHHAFRYLRGTFPSNADFKKFVTLLYKGLQYGIKFLKEPPDYQLKKKKVCLPQPNKACHKKILFMDLDQTLIHTQREGSLKFETTDVKIVNQKRKLHFNIRPYCFQFLKKMSKIYNIYVFTAGTDKYAKEIITYLNKDQQNILGLLHRKNCIQMGSGNFIKDLRIVQNRQLKDIVIVDNLAHSFGLQIENGIPILQFTDQKDDNQLFGLQQLLVDMSQASDVRIYLKEKLALRKILNFSQRLYIQVENYFSA